MTMEWMMCGRSSRSVHGARRVSRAPRWIAVGLGLLLSVTGGTATRAAEEGARDFYVGREFEKAIESCRGRSDHESMVIRVISYAEKYALYKQKADQAELNALRKALKGALGLKDMKMLASLGAISTNPNGSDLAAGLMDEVLDTARTVEDMDAVLETIRAAPGPKAVLSALSALQRHLTQVRKYVDTGGTMPDDERGLFGRKDLLDTLVPLLEVKVHRASAQKSLVLIEEPALAAVEAQSGVAAMETARKIRDAMTKREKKRPGSAWYGAADSK